MLNILVFCNGEQIFEGSLDEWLDENNDDRDYLIGICEPLLNGTNTEVTFSELSGYWTVKITGIV